MRRPPGLIRHQLSRATRPPGPTLRRPRTPARPAGRPGPRPGTSAARPRSAPTNQQRSARTALCPRRRSARQRHRRRGARRKPGIKPSWYTALDRHGPSGLFRPAHPAGPGRTSSLSAGVLDHSLVTKPRVIEGYDRIGDRRTRGTDVSSYGHLPLARGRQGVRLVQSIEFVVQVRMVRPEALEPAKLGIVALTWGQVMTQLVPDQVHQ